MESKFITLEYKDYILVYSHYKSILNKENWARQSRNIAWENIGLQYYESLPKSQRRFKILDHNKWMQHWMLVKIAGNND
jgi:hypothetical protein